MSESPTRPSATLHPRKDSTPQRLITRLVIYGSIGLLVLLLSGVLMLQSLSQIRTSAEQTLTELLPAISNQQRTSMNLERLVRFGEAVLNSASPMDRRKNLLAGHVLQSDAAFEANPGLVNIVKNVYQDMEAIADLRNRSDELTKNIFTSLRHATAELLLLEARLGQHTNQVVASSRQILTQDDTLALRDIIRDIGNIMHRLPTDHELETVFLRQAQYEALRQRLVPFIKKMDAMPQSTRLMGLDQELFPMCAERIRVTQKSHKLWTDARESIEDYHTGISSDSALRTASRIRLISGESSVALQLGGVTLLVIFAVGLALHLYARKDIVSPLMQNVSELESICTDEGGTDRREYSPPHSGILEIDMVGKAVKRLSMTMKELNERTQQLEETNRALQNEIAERRRVEAALGRARDQAESAARSKSEFLASMSHEIRTPMNSILGMAELLEETELTPRQKEYVTMFRSSGELLLGIINDILDISKVESGRLHLESVPFDIRETAARSLGLVSGPAREKGLDVSFSVDDDVPREVLGDPVRLHQILLNLMGNAVKFTQEGSATLRISRTPESPDVLLFTVRDTGIGIPPEVQESIFERFTQADSSTTRKFGGTGLGLAICKAFTELMGGRIWMHSLPGRGATFSFTARLPASTDQQLPARKGQAAPKLPSPGELRSTRVLLVEDSQNNRLLVSHYLKDWPIELEYAENGREALDLHGEKHFDLILMDIQMPVMDGLDATRAIRAQEQAANRPRTPIVALTANAFAEDRARCLAAGCDDYLAKPVKKTDLILTLARLSEASASIDRNTQVS